jgi:hypothetical protein
LLGRDHSFIHFKDKNIQMMGAIHSGMKATFDSYYGFASACQSGKAQQDCIFLENRDGCS